MPKPTVDLSRRAEPHHLPERMDQPCTYAELRGCLRDIALVNRLTFAYRPTLSWLTGILRTTPATSGPLRIVDVGCGYGDSLRRVHGWAARHGIAVALTGIDRSGDAIRAATEATPAGMRILWVQDDAFSYSPADGVDVILSSLLMHHLEEPEIVRFLGWMEETARLGWFINDLHRTDFPYRAFGWMARLLPLHPFVRHDGGVSIQRSFRPKEWQQLILAAGLPLDQISVREYRPARLCVGRIKNRMPSIWPDAEERNRSAHLPYPVEVL